MGIEMTNEDGVCRATIAGELTIYGVAEYRDQLLEGCHTRKGLTLDLSGVTEMDTAGVQFLLALRRHLGDTEEGLRLQHPSTTVRETLGLLRLGELCRDDEEEAA